VRRLPEVATASLCFANGRIPGRNHVRRPGGREALQSSLWERAAMPRLNANVPEVTKFLRTVVGRGPHVETYDVAIAFHRIAAAAAAANDKPLRAGGGAAPPPLKMRLRGQRSIGRSRELEGGKDHANLRRTRESYEHHGLPPLRMRCRHLSGTQPSPAFCGDLKKHRRRCPPTACGHCPRRRVCGALFARAPGSRKDS